MPSQRQVWPWHVIVGIDLLQRQRPAVFTTPSLNPIRDGVPRSGVRATPYLGHLYAYSRRSHVPDDEPKLARARRDADGADGSPRAAGGVAEAAPATTTPAPAPAASLARGPSSSGPIQLSLDDKTLWVANPETDTVTATNVAGGKKERIIEIPVGKQPRNVAISPDGKRVFVANSGENTLTVIDASVNPPAKVRDDRVGIEPYGLAFTPNGKKLYVANAFSNSVSVVDPVTYQVLTTVTGIGAEPRGIAITNDGDDKDDDEKVYVTQFFGVDRAGV